MAPQAGGLSVRRGGIRRETDVLRFNPGSRQNSGFLCHEPRKGSKRGDQHLIKWNSCLCTVFTHDPTPNASTQDSIHLIQPLSALALSRFSYVRLFQREDYSLVSQALSFFSFFFFWKKKKQNTPWRFNGKGTLEKKNIFNY